MPKHCFLINILSCEPIFNLTWSCFFAKSQLRSFNISFFLIQSLWMKLSRCICARLTHASVWLRISTHGESSLLVSLTQRWGGKMHHPSRDWIILDEEWKCFSAVSRSWQTLNGLKAWRSVMWRATNPAGRLWLHQGSVAVNPKSQFLIWVSIY